MQFEPLSKTRLDADAWREAVEQRAPLLARCDYDQPSVFRPDSMLREARKQKGFSAGPARIDPYHSGIYRARSTAETPS
jgi:hypothetical protein